MRVRPARPGDPETLRAAVSRSREAAVFDDVDVPLLDVSAAGVREAAGQADCSFVVEEDDRPVGVAVAHPDRDGLEAELLALWVHPEYPGQEIVDRLLSRVADALSREGVSRLRTTVDPDRPSEREFYHARGFERRDPSAAPDEADQVLVADLSRLR